MAGRWHAILLGTAVLIACTVHVSADHPSTPVEVFTCGGCTWYVTDGLLTLQGGDGNPPCSGCAEIDLHNKSISAIHPDAFKFDTTSVEALDLAANNLGSQPMPDGIFAPLVNLERLFLSGNNLFDLPENIFKQNSRLTYLELYRQNARPFSGVSTTAFKTMMLKPVPDQPPLTTDIATVNISWVSCQFDFSPEFAELVSDRVVHTYSNPAPGSPPGYSNATFVGAARNWTFSSLPYNYFSLPPCATCLRGQFYTMDNKCMNCSTGNATCKYEVKPCNTFGDRVCSRFPPLWRRQGTVCDGTGFTGGGSGEGSGYGTGYGTGYGSGTETGSHTGTGTGTGTPEGTGTGTGTPEGTGTGTGTPEGSIAT